MCIDLRWNKPAINEPFWWWPCNEGPAQRFIINENANLELEAHSDRCVRETYNRYLVAATCSEKADRTWVFDHDPGEY